MKLLITLSAVVFVASALPADVKSRAANFTSNFGQAGFGAGATGGAGGAVWNVFDPWALRDALNSDAPRIIHIRGRIDLTQLFTGSPGVQIRTGPNKSIIGLDRTAEIFGGGIGIIRRENIIIDNIKMTNALSYAPGEQPDGNGGIISQQPGPWSNIDAIEIRRSERIWINHCEFSDDPWNAATVSNERRRHDGLIDIVTASSWISISNTIFRNHNFVSLIGNGDGLADIDSGRLKVTYYLNWFRGTNQRNPRVRFGEVHMLNNLYTDVTFYGIGAGAGASIYAENNVFVNTPRAWMFPAGTPNPMSNFLNVGNLLINSSHDNLPSNVNWRPSNYYNYNPMPARDVENHVRRYAGPR